MRGGEDGIYHCEIPDGFDIIQMVYIGVYTANTGSPNVTSLIFNSSSNTFTCTSTGGPATVVTWKRDGSVITLNATYQQTKRVVDTVAGTYQTVLTIDPSVDQSDIFGSYNCTVENARGKSSMTADSTTLSAATVGATKGPTLGPVAAVISLSPLAVVACGLIAVGMIAAIWRLKQNRKLSF